MKQAEQSSTSTEVPKTKLALLDKYKEEPVKELQRSLLNYLCLPVGEC
jgi:hypothetical protein